MAPFDAPELAESAEPALPGGKLVESTTTPCETLFEAASFEANEIAVVLVAGARGLSLKSAPSKGGVAVRASCPVLMSAPADPASDAVPSYMRQTAASRKPDTVAVRRLCVSPPLPHMRCLDSGMCASPPGLPHSHPP
jgi:hypothetical protein